MRRCSSAIVRSPWMFCPTWSITRSWMPGNSKRNAPLFWRKSCCTVICTRYVQDLMGRLFRPDQPLGRAISGTEETVSGISRKQMLDYMCAYYHPKNILVSVSGSVDHDELVEKAKVLFPAWLFTRIRDPLAFLRVWMSQKPIVPLPLSLRRL